MANSKHNILSVNLEDYFQVATLRKAIPPRHWPRFEMRVEQNTIAALDLLDRHNVKATFFTLGWLADRCPDLIREVADRGHELASKGYHHSLFGTQSLSEFADDALRAKHVIENAAGREVLGYRVAEGSLPHDDFAAYEALAKAGYSYDSSVRPFGPRFVGQKDWQRTRQLSGDDWTLTEVPFSSVPMMGVPMPVTGGNYMRQMPQGLHDNLLRHYENKVDAPWHFYFHVWELDADQPRLSAMNSLNRIRQYRNLDQMPARISSVLAAHDFAPVAESLALEAKPVAPHAVAAINATAARMERRKRQQASVVVPCYYEQDTLPYLARTLDSFADLNKSWLDLSFVLVDDGSKDRTWEVMHELFGDRANFKLVQHPQNRGIAAATMTGIQHATDEIVCGIDADCTFDPHTLAVMIRRLTDGVDMVQASPYHKDGGVLNVPEWRLALSKNLSRIYRALLNHRFASYTACFRVYRRSAIKDVHLDDEGFLGIAEMFIRLDQNGSHIVEFPTVLESRLIGDSKMKTVPVIFAHLGMVRSLISKKVRALFASRKSERGTL